MQYGCRLLIPIDPNKDICELDSSPIGGVPWPGVFKKDKVSYGIAEKDCDKVLAGLCFFYAIPPSKEIFITETSL